MEQFQEIIKNQEFSVFEKKYRELVSSENYEDDQQWYTEMIVKIATIYGRFDIFEFIYNNNRYTTDNDYLEMIGDYDEVKSDFFSDEIQDTWWIENDNCEGHYKIYDFMLNKVKPCHSYYDDNSMYKRPDPKFIKLLLKHDKKILHTNINPYLFYFIREYIEKGYYESKEEQNIKECLRILLNKELELLQNKELELLQNKN